MQLQQKPLLGHLGVGDAADLRHNLSAAALFEDAVRQGEASVVSTGALSADTGQYTGRSPKDKFFVEEPGSRERIWWHPGNRPISEASFDRLLAKQAAFIEREPVYVQDLFACADPRYRLRVRVVTELAWHSLFAQHLFRRPTPEEREGFEPDFTVVSLPSVTADPAVDGTRTDMFVLVNFAKRMIIIGGTHYAGEIKKGIFSALNYLMPESGALPMHCSANTGEDGTTALFFGLSGTGKTTLSSDPERHLIGDDEHGWSAAGVFNFEGGCYAKTIKLSEAGEPEIWAATNRFASVLENVQFDPATRVPDFDDSSKTENTRSAYPLEAIPGVEPSGQGGHPKNVVFLSYDAFGVLPPVVRLDDDEQVKFFFLSGYTSKVAGTERGVNEPEPVFSACFAAPFLVLHPREHADMLIRRVREHGARVWVVNTGLVGGGYGTGHRISLTDTRAIVRAIVDGKLEGVETRRDEVFGYEVPVSVPGVGADVLDTRSAWDDDAAYEAQARRLKAMFDKNIRTFESNGAAGG
ncbi:MAG: phosphoenolpyruvate carboxykinase (ATP) [Candidatus Dormiibacterota bacterium]